MSPRSAARSTVVAAGAVVVAVLLVAVMVAVVVDGAQRSDSLGHPVATTGRPLAAPQALDDLPQGAPATWPYLLGSTLVLGDQRVSLDARPAGAVDAADTVVVRFRDGRIVRVDKSSARVDELAGSSSGPTIVDPASNFVAWQAPSTGRAEVVLATLRGRPVVLDRQIFPAVPSCCDNPFRVLGATQYAGLYVSLPAGGRAWVWDTYEGQEGVPHVVPDSDEYVREIGGLSGGHIDDVTANEVVVRYLPTAKNDRTVFGIGDASSGRYRETERIVAAEADFQDPRARRIIHWTNGGRGWITKRRSGPGAAPGATDPGTRTPLLLPASVDAHDLLWETPDEFLLEVTEELTGRRALVRCDARSGACEMAAALEAKALLAGP